MKEQQQKSAKDNKESQKQKSAGQKEDAVESGQKAIAIDKKINNIPEPEVSKDAEKWRNEG